MLSCRAIVGIPSPIIVWRRRDGLPLSHRAKEEYPGTIIISDITIADAGEYECHASNIAGEATQTASITVNEPPTITISPDLQELTLTEGDELKLECNAVGHPMPNVEWKAPDFEVQVQVAGFPPLRTLPSSRAVVHKYNVQRSDSGSYTCHAINAAGTEEKYIYLIVQPKRGDVGELESLLIFHLEHN